MYKLGLPYIITADDKSKSDSLCLLFPKLRDALFPEKPAIIVNLFQFPKVMKMRL